MQLGARGVSVLFSAGDGGVGGSLSDGPECTNFLPTFPSSCPYVTSVGSTYNYAPEVGSSFTSGGFSNVFKTPSWQKAAVRDYMGKLYSKNEYRGIRGRFNKDGRGFPDVSLRGENYQVIVGKRTDALEGTSASTPVFASMIALLNAELGKAGKNSLGYLNPMIYSSHAAKLGVFNDVVNGTNPGCGTNGFGAEAGWDAVTGLGTPKFWQMRKLVGL
jgi:tripeptidyl-peptidase I